MESLITRSRSLPARNDAMVTANGDVVTVSRDGAQVEHGVGPGFDRDRDRPQRLRRRRTGPARRGSVARGDDAARVAGAGAHPPAVGVERQDVGAQQLERVCRVGGDDDAAALVVDDRRADRVLDRDVGRLAGLPASSGAPRRTMSELATLPGCRLRTSTRVATKLCTTSNSNVAPNTDSLSETLLAGLSVRPRTPSTAIS